MLLLVNRGGLGVRFARAAGVGLYEVCEGVMVVCLCKGVRCHEVRRLVREGAADVDAVGRACGAGTDCGGCRGVIDELIEGCLEESAPRPAAMVRGGRRLSLPMAGSGPT
ncbi:MAG: (2Fe-2S)-binding protein [Myxococcales bacterium]|nr:(2Fe-2S)-binding protein [Myxococcales bacterium]